MPNKEPLEPVSFQEAVEAAIFHIQRALVSLRDHVRLSDEDDPSILISASLFYAVLEDGRIETEQLMDEKERQGRTSVS